MDIKIAPLAQIKFQKKTNRQKTNNNETFYSTNLLMDTKSALALKSQIMFTGQTEKPNGSERFKDLIMQYGLKLSVGDVAYVFNRENFSQSHHKDLQESGEIALEALLRRELLERYPLKHEDALDQIASKIKDEGNIQTASKKLFGNLGEVKTGKKLSAKDRNSLFYGFIGLIASQKDGLGQLDKFFKKYVTDAIIPEDMALDANCFEELKKVIESHGGNYDNVYIESKMFKNKREYSVYYKDLLLAKRIDAQRSQTAREECIYDAIDTVNGKEVSLRNARNKLPYKNPKIPTNERFYALCAFAKKYGLHFNDPALLHRAFLFGTLKDHTIVPHAVSNMPLAYVGEAVLYFCTNQYATQNHPKLSKEERDEKIEAFLSDENLASMSRKMRLKDDWAVNVDVRKSTKKDVDMFKAMVGAIFIDGKDRGLKNAQEFLNQHFLKKYFYSPAKQKQPEQEDITETTQTLRATAFADGTPNLNYSAISKKQAVYEILTKYSLPLRPAVIEYIFNRESFDDNKFNAYKTLGKEFYTLYLKTLLTRHNPLKAEGQITRIFNEAIHAHEKIIPAQLFDGILLEDTDENKRQAYFYALLGALITESPAKEKSAESFLKRQIQQIIIASMPQAEPNNLENLWTKMKKFGYDPNDLRIITRYSDDLYETEVYYQNRLLGEPFKSYSVQIARNNACKMVGEKIARGNIFISEIKGKTPPEDITKPKGERVELLREFCQKTGLKFRDIRLLNRAFIPAELLSGEINTKKDTYNILEFIGDSVLGYCVKKIIAQNLPDCKKSEVEEKYIAFAKNQNLARLSKGLNLSALAPDGNREEYDEKTHADFFEALIGAIYLDSKEDGIKNVLDFLEANYKEMILGE